MSKPPGLACCWIVAAAVVLPTLAVGWVIAAMAVQVVALFMALGGVR